jgi:ATP-dependent Zn protease
MGLSNFFNSLFGKAKKTTDETIDKATEIAIEAKETLEELADSATKKLDELHLSEKVDGFVKTAKEKASEAAGWAEEKAHEVKDAIEDVVEKAEEKIDELTKDKNEAPKTEEKIDISKDKE